ncbi:hypothetical protein [Rhizobium sp. SL42]|uniref:hypothetical protein n=1 Tax=Rhizobium sp. SL42 TaxID=2806346 RepID=UPI001F2AC299|nr:hypothetical protein [Rhizobium sp. SL42]UJW77209.1 hypothetical protein IM739_19225 [Rhizobium sp. SL42]
MNRGSVGTVYAVLFAGQTAAATALFWIVFPWFHQVITHIGEKHELRLSQHVAIIACAALLHGFYWTRLRWVPVVAPCQNVVLAHLCSFCSRVSFFFGGALFSTLFFRHLPELDALPSFGRLVLGVIEILTVLFALFCYSQDLDRLAKAFEEPPNPIGQ